MTDLPEYRQNRRSVFKDQKSLVITDTLNEELVEDLLAATPKVTTLQFDIGEDYTFDTSPLTELPDITRLTIKEGASLESVNLTGLRDMPYLYPEAVRRKAHKHLARALSASKDGLKVGE